MGIDKIYQTGASRVLASLDAYELTKGTGTVQFFPVDIRTGTNNTDLILTENAISAVDGFSVVENATIELNFDLDFFTPVIMEGDATFLFPYVLFNASPMLAILTLKFFHVDSDSTETQLGSSVEVDASVPAGDKFFSGKITIPKITFKKGEKFRVELTITGDTTTEEIFVYFEPKNRNTAAAIKHGITRVAEINLPIKVPR